MQVEDRARGKFEDNARSDKVRWFRRTQYEIACQIDKETSFGLSGLTTTQDCDAGSAASLVTFREKQQRWQRQRAAAGGENIGLKERAENPTLLRLATERAQRELAAGSQNQRMEKVKSQSADCADGGDNQSKHTGGGWTANVNVLSSVGNAGGGSEDTVGFCGDFELCEVGVGGLQNNANGQVDR